MKAPSGVSRQRSNMPRPTPGSKRDGGIKLLDITEQPIGRDAKRKKKGDEEKTKEEKIAPEAEQTPDYAAGLSMIPPSPAPAYSVQPHIVPEHDSSGMLFCLGCLILLFMSLLNAANQTEQINMGNNTEELVPNVNDTSLLDIKQNIQTQPQLIQQVSRSVIGTQQYVLPPQMQPISMNAQNQPGEGPKKLSLSKEQMMEAQEMFRSSNKVTRPEKALILGFMAGNRENPCPNLGSIVTIKLSENEEQVLKPDGAYEDMFVETHYQMNYETGEGKRIKKYMPRHGTVQNSLHLSQQQAV